jgi:hypothetical protein
LAIIRRPSPAGQKGHGPRAEQKPYQLTAFHAPAPDILPGWMITRQIIGIFIKRAALHGG